MSYYREQLEKYLAGLEVKADCIADIGGKQNPVKRRVKTWDVNKYHILDIPQFNIESESVLYDKKHRLKYDVVFCLEVFEYLINPYQAMLNIAYVLKDKGRAYITFAFVYPHHNELELDSTRYTEFGIKRLCYEVGLEVSKITYRKDRTGLLVDFYRADGMRAAKEYRHHNTTGFIVELVKL